MNDYEEWRAELERKMDLGVQPYVVFEGDRYAFDFLVLDELLIKNQQTIEDPELLVSLMDLAMVNLHMQMVIAASQVGASIPKL